MFGASYKLYETGEKERVECWLFTSLYSMGVCGALWTYTGYPANGWEAAERCLVTCVVSTGVRGGSRKLPWPLSQTAWQTFYEIKVGWGSK